MKHEFSNKTPMLRLVFATAALTVTLSIGGFIDFLALGYATVASAEHPSQTAERQSQHTSPNREFNQEVVMKRNQSDIIVSIIAAVVFAFVAGCASMPSAEVVEDGLQAELADSRP